jgi:cbb3-type cytochrome oxidase cytochrome c subunit
MEFEGTIESNMKSINIEKPFTFLHDDGKYQAFAPGMHEVADHIADHWYVQAHTTTPPKVIPKEGTPEYAVWQASRMHRQHIIDAAQELAEDDDAPKIRRRPLKED